MDVDINRKNGARVIDRRREKKGALTSTYRHELPHSASEAVDGGGKHLQRSALARHRLSSK